MLNYAFVIAAACWLFAAPSSAQAPPDTVDDNLGACLQTSFEGADEDTTIAELKASCRALIARSRNDEPRESSSEQTLTAEAGSSAENSRLLSKRLRIEALNRANRFMLTPHRRNYFLPISFQPSPNVEP